MIEYIINNLFFFCEASSMQPNTSVLTGKKGLKTLIADESKIKNPASIFYCFTAVYFQCEIHTSKSHKMCAVLICHSKTAG